MWDRQQPAAACGGQVGHGNRFVKIGGGDPNSDQSPLTPRVQQKQQPSQDPYIEAAELASGVLPLHEKQQGFRVRTRESEREKEIRSSVQRGLESTPTGRRIIILLCKSVVEHWFWCDFLLISVFSGCCCVASRWSSVCPGASGTRVNWEAVKGGRGHEKRDLWGWTCDTRLIGPIAASCRRHWIYCYCCWIVIAAKRDKTKDTTGLSAKRWVVLEITWFWLRKINRSGLFSGEARFRIFSGSGERELKERKWLSEETLNSLSLNCSTWFAICVITILVQCPFWISGFKISCVSNSLYFHSSYNLQAPLNRVKL